MTAEVKKILIVDDEADVQEFVQVALEDGGYEFATASDGEEALEQVRSAGPDLVILVVQMPKKDGFQVFAEMRRDEATKSIPVIMLTAVGERTGLKFSGDDMGEYFGSEPEAYIDKPIDPGKLQETVRSILGG